MFPPVDGPAGAMLPRWATWLCRSAVGRRRGWPPRWGNAAALGDLALPVGRWPSARLAGSTGTAPARYRGGHDAVAVRLTLTVHRRGRYPLVASMARLHACGARPGKIQRGWLRGGGCGGLSHRAVAPDADPSIRPHHAKAYDCAHIQPEGR